MSELPPGSIMVLGSLLLAGLRGNTMRIAMLALPLLSFWHMLTLPTGYSVELDLLDYTLVPVRVDKLSLVWGWVYHIAAFLSMVYALHVRDRVQHIAGLSYAGSAIAAAFAGDLITLFIFWELTAVTSVFLIWAARERGSYRVGMRYLLIQVASGVILLAGILIRIREVGSIEFGHIGLNGLGGLLIFVAFGIKCAFPFLHNWLQDSYPAATPTGAVILSAFTTKLAVYALARSFAGTEILIPIGAAMTLFPIVFAVIENDLRRVLAYSLNNQLGFMVVGVGIGTELAINGTAAHAFAHIIYKGLLFMSMGAVLHRTGTCKASELGGLHKSMPWTTAFCIIGSLSISGFPFFSGFVTKSMTLTAAADTHVIWLSVVLLIASAGVVDHSGIKIPFFAFFAKDQGHRVKEAPLNMLVAMAAMAALCLLVGLFPAPLYSLLPFPVDYVPYTTSHVMTSLQLLFFAALAFALMWRMHASKRRGLATLAKYPPELLATNLDTDWLYRRLLPMLAVHVGLPIQRAFSFLRNTVYDFGVQTHRALRKENTPPGSMGEPQPAGSGVFWVLVTFSLALTLSLASALR